MDILLYRGITTIKAGFASRCPALGIVAHGYSPEVADKNLERSARQFLAPLQRAGTLDADLRELGIEARGDGELRIVLAEKP